MNLIIIFPEYAAEYHEYSKKYTLVFTQWAKGAGCSFIYCDRYIVKQVFYYQFFCKFCQLFTYFDMFRYSDHQRMYPK